MTKHLLDEAFRGIPAGTLVDGRYNVVRLISQGGAGLLYEVEHVRTGRRLALKTLLQRDDHARLEHEARAASLMKNAHAMKVTDMAVAADIGPYLVMDLVEGETLRALLVEREQLSVPLSVNIVLQLCECLSEAHEHAIIHGDLKPESVLLAPVPLPCQYDVKVLDLGAAFPPEAGPGQKTLARASQTSIGVPRYACLEQLQDPGSIDVRADVFALGALLYECLSGRRPFESDTLDDLLRALRAGPPAPLRHLRPDAPAEVCNVAMRALSSRRDDRQASARDVATALLPYGDAALGAWLRVEDRRSDVVARPVSAKRVPMVDAERPPIEAAPAPARTERAAARDSEPTDRTSAPVDKGPKASSWNQDSPRSLPGALPPPSGRNGGAAASVDEAVAPRPMFESDQELTSTSWNIGGRPSNGGEQHDEAPDSEPPTAAWNVAGLRGLVGPDTIADAPAPGADELEESRFRGDNQRNPLGAPPPAAGSPASPRYAASGWSGDDSAEAAIARPTGADVPAAFEATQVAPATSQPAFLGIALDMSRDTPTEMYRKSDVGPPPEEPFGPARLVARAQRDDRPPAQRDDRPSAQLDDRPSTQLGDRPSAGPDPLQALFGAAPPYASTLVLNDGASAQSALLSGLSGESPSNARPSAVPVSSHDEGDYSTVPFRSGPPFPRLLQSSDKPGWQRSLDRALVRVGDGLERRLGGPVSWFQTASAGQRIAFIIVSCLLVLLASGATYYYVVFMR